MTYCFLASLQLIEYLHQIVNKLNNLLHSRTLSKDNGLKSLELSGKPLELATLQRNDEKSVSVNA